LGFLQQISVDFYDSLVRRKS